MKISREELAKLLELIELTQEEEINCEEFLSLLPKYLEKLRDQRVLEPEHKAVLHHLKICPECREELDGLIDALNEEII